VIETFFGPPFFPQGCPAMGHRVTDVELPPLFRPLESAVHPHVRRIEQRAEEWIHLPERKTCRYDCGETVVSRAK